jgi:hypothetical protein
MAPADPVLSALPAYAENDPYTWPEYALPERIFLCDLPAFIARFCGKEDTAKELILNYAHKGGFERLGGVCADMPELQGRSGYISCRFWGKQSCDVNYPIDWSRSCVSYVRGPLPSPYSLSGLAWEILHEGGFLPVEPVFTMRLVSVHRFAVADLLRRAGLLPPPVMLPLERPTAEVPQPIPRELSESASNPAPTPSPVPMADDAPVVGKSKQPPARKGRAWSTLLTLLKAHPKRDGVSDSAYAEWLAEKQDPKLGKPTSAKTFKNLMPQAMRELADEARRNSIPRDMHPKKVSRGITRGKSGKA